MRHYIFIVAKTFHVMKKFFSSDRRDASRPSTEVVAETEVMTATKVVAETTSHFTYEQPADRHSTHTHTHTYAPSGMARNKRSGQPLRGDKLSIV